MIKFSCNRDNSAKRPRVDSSLLTTSLHHPPPHLGGQAPLLQELAHAEEGSGRGRGGDRAAHWAKSRLRQIARPVAGRPHRHQVALDQRVHVGQADLVLQLKEVGVACRRDARGGLAGRMWEGGHPLKGHRASVKLTTWHRSS